MEQQQQQQQAQEPQQMTLPIFRALPDPHHIFQWMLQFRGINILSMPMYGGAYFLCFPNGIQLPYDVVIDKKNVTSVFESFVYNTICACIETQRISMQDPICICGFCDAFAKRSADMAMTAISTAEQLMIDFQNMGSAILQQSYLVSQPLPPEPMAPPRFPSLIEEVKAPTHTFLKLQMPVGAYTCPIPPPNNYNTQHNAAMDYVAYAQTQAQQQQQQQYQYQQQQQQQQEQIYNQQYITQQAQICAQNAYNYAHNYASNIYNQWQQQQQQQPQQSLLPDPQPQQIPNITPLQKEIYRDIYNVISSLRHPPSNNRIQKEQYSSSEQFKKINYYNKKINITSLISPSIIKKVITHIYNGNTIDYIARDIIHSIAYTHIILIYIIGIMYKALWTVETISSTFHMDINDVTKYVNMYFKLDSRELFN